jgi:hypothetical protein
MNITPGPVIQDEEYGKQEWEVETILDYRKQGTVHYYLIKWKYYPNSENTWEPRKNLKNSETLIEQYHQQQAQYQTPGTHQNRKTRTRKSSPTRRLMMMRRVPRREDSPPPKPRPTGSPQAPATPARIRGRKGHQLPSANVETSSKAVSGASRAGQTPSPTQRSHHGPEGFPPGSPFETESGTALWKFGLSAIRTMTLIQEAMAEVNKMMKAAEVLWEVPKDIKARYEGFLLGSAQHTLRVAERQIAEARAYDNIKRDLHSSSLGAALQDRTLLTLQRTQRSVAGSNTQDAPTRRQEEQGRDNIARERESRAKRATRFELPEDLDGIATSAEDSWEKDETTDDEIREHPPSYTEAIRDEKQEGGTECYEPPIGQQPTRQNLGQSGPARTREDRVRLGVRTQAVEAKEARGKRANKGKGPGGPT